MSSLFSAIYGLSSDHIENETSSKSTKTTHKFRSLKPEVDKAELIADPQLLTSDFTTKIAHAQKKFQVYQEIWEKSKH